MNESTYLRQRAVLMADLQGKFEREDWHGVADAAMDLRDLDEYWRGFQEGGHANENTD